MPTLQSMAYPNAVVLVMDGLQEEFPSANVHPSVPPSYEYGEDLIVVRRVGGGPDDDDVTDYPVVQVAAYAGSYLRAAQVQAEIQVTILGWPMTEVGPDNVLVDEAEIYVGEQEIPDIIPDERRVVATYRLGLRRQFRP